ncbi:hypothetical protein M3P21_15445 [Ruegeria sp. 2012CJ41-6]|uniref:Uncharacterized protein n=1 Tax=Ruegeria spongiae TaxID=2942209 RepID=A0ABT0Q4Y1_9RHOB|nr:hypothetical protein [Ruegeria spongiae]MCL6284926.1 hypothetical protein [Ruegeria spongiae]
MADLTHLRRHQIFVRPCRSIRKLNPGENDLDQIASLAESLARTDQKNPRVASE